MSIIGPDGQPQGGPKKQVTKDMLLEVRCETCNANMFQPLFYMMRLPAIATGASKDTMVPIQAWSCAGCGEVPKQFDLDNLLRDAF